MKKTSTVMCHDCGHEETDVNDVVCNKCGETCKVQIGLGEEPINFSFLHLHVEMIGSYASIWDAQKVTFDLCEGCMQRLMQTFEIKPEVTEVPM